MNRARPFLTKRKRSKYWYVVTTHHTTKKRSYKSTGTEDRAEAEQIKRELEMSLGFMSKKAQQAERVKGVILSGIERTTGAIIQGKTPLETIWTEYQRNERVRALKPNTLRGNRTILNSFLKFLQDAGIESVEQTTYEVAKAYLDSMRLDNKADGTITNHRHCLHGIFKRVKRAVGLPSNPFEDVEAPFRPKRDAHRCFKPKELKKLLESVSPEWQIIITLSFYTGLRFGDCCQFDMDFIEWDRDVIRITPEKTERFNKELIIPMHPTLKRAIQGYTNILTGYLVPSFAELQRKRSCPLNREFNSILKDLGFEKYTAEGILDFHSLRHTFNTTLANGGVDVSTRMKLVGHSDIKTNQIYNHAIEPLKKAIECIPALA